VKYFSLREPRDAVQIYAHYSDSNNFNLAQSPEVFAGKVVEGEEDHFDDAGNQLKSYGIGLFYNALYVPVDKASIIEDQLAGSGVDFYTAQIVTAQNEYTAFRSFNLFDESNPVPMCRRVHPTHDDFLYTKQYFSEEFLDFLSEHFDFRDFYRISLPETKDKDA
jgi:hypothetical protein